MMRSLSRFLALVGALLLASVVACSGGGGDADATPDVTLDVPDGSGDAAPDVAADAVPDAPADTLDATDAAPDVPVEMVDRHFAFRAIFGLSMGANATLIAARHPGRFDVAGGQGGYLDYRYLGHLVRDRAFGGFCPMEQILANLDTIDEMDTPGFCGPVAASEPYEFDWDFNHFVYDFGPTEFSRSFYLDVFEGFMLLYGNFFSYNPDNPLLPPGVPLEWHQGTSDEQKCAEPYHVGKPYNFNKEYNPLGEYDLVTVCDGENPVGCKDGDPTKCGEDNPDYLKLAASYDPAYPHTRPLSFVLAVDYNGNGRRDYAEPIVVNSNERWDDVGADGCPNDREDGMGGCFADAIPHGDGVDANGDDFDLLANPGGTERDHQWQEGEPFEDLGLDGVSKDVTGEADYGEGNGTFDYNPHYLDAVAHDLHTYFADASLDAVQAIDWEFDGGIRDPLSHLTSNMHLLVPFVERGNELRTYEDFAGRPGTLMPDTTCGGLMDYLGTFDWSARGIGRNVLLKYGDPNASAQAIEAGDGKHVGDGCQIVNRGVVGYAIASWRWPEPIVKKEAALQGRNVLATFYSPSLQDRRWFSITLPPGYDDADKADLRYPMVAFLTGHGMDVTSTSYTAILTSLFMAQGNLPRFILVAPDGQCCKRRLSTGQRLCGCLKIDNEWNCVDPTCQGPHDTCPIEIVPGGDLDEECNKGNFYANQLVDRWGNTDASTYMRYEDGVMDLLDWVDQNFRTRAPATYSVPK